MENKMTPEEALNNIAIAMVETFVGKDEPRRTEQLNKFLNCNECQVIEQSFDELEKQKQILEVLKNKDVDLQNFKNSCNCEDYNEYVINEKGLLTEKEYDLLGEWLNNGK